MLYDDERWGEREFLASTDERFRPVDVTVGPDGALYVVDMYRGIIQQADFMTDFLRKESLRRDLEQPINLGRIYRRNVTTTDLIGNGVKALMNSRDQWEKLKANVTRHRHITTDDPAKVNLFLCHDIRGGS